MNRPFCFDVEPDVRRFFLYDGEGNLTAFVYFDPIYQNERVIGYTTSFKRRVPDASPYCEMGITKYAIEQFQSEGRQLVKLGLSPLAEIENRQFRSNPMMHWSFRYGFRSFWVNRFFYNLKGHAQFKNRFGGVAEKTHYAAPMLASDLRIFAMLRLCRIL